MPDTDTFNPWEFGSGLREEYDFTIHMAYFGTDAAYADGQIYLLILQGVDEEGEDVREIFGVGKDWESLDGGKSITHPSGPKHKLNRNSIYAKFCNYAMEACEKVGSDFFIGKSPFVAETWINTRWHMREKEASRAFTTRSGEKVEARNRVMPDEFLGLADEDAPESPVAVPQTASGGGTAAKRQALLARARSASQPSSNGIVESLTVLAKSSDSFNIFTDAALKLEDVLNDDALAADVVDSSSTGFYTRVRG